MKKYIFVSLLISLASLCNAQKQTSDFICGDWYCSTDLKLKLDVNELASFSRQSSDSVYCFWSFGSDWEFTQSLSMHAPDNKGLMKYKSNQGDWTINEPGDEIAITMDGAVYSFKIVKISRENLTIKRII